MLAFSTASSEAAYPRTLEALDRFGVPPRIASFVLPLGYSFNLDGSMMYMTFATIFIAQAYGIDLSLGQEITMLLVLMITSKGMAGVPRASLVVIAATHVDVQHPRGRAAADPGRRPFPRHGPLGDQRRRQRGRLERGREDGKASSIPRSRPTSSRRTRRRTSPADRADRAITSKPNGLVDARRRRGEEFRARLRHVEAVLEPDAELAGDVDARARSEKHMPGASGVVSPWTRLTGSCTSMPMPWPVRCDSAGQLVARAVAPAFIGAAHRVIDASRRARRPSPRPWRSAGRDGPGPTPCAARRSASAPNTKVREMSAW